MSTITSVAFHEALEHAETWNPDRVLRWAFDTFGTDVAIASAFGAEGIVLIDIACRIQKPAVFTLDTGFLFPETIRLMKHVEERHGIQIERINPECSPEEQEHVHGPDLWSRNPHLCCEIRKIKPLQKKLSGLRAWITAIRRDQTPARANAGKVEWDSKFDCIKINPLADWTSEMVWAYIHRNQLVYNPLHDRNYPSVGCTHCTRAIVAGEPPRAGRWSGFNKTECGLHDRSASPATAD